MARTETTDCAVLVEMLVRYKPGVPEPEKAGILASLRSQGYDQVIQVNCVKYFRLKFPGSSLEQARADAATFGEILLANPVTENFEILSVDFV